MTCKVGSSPPTFSCYSYSSLSFTAFSIHHLLLLGCEMSCHVQRPNHWWRGPFWPCGSDLYLLDFPVALWCLCFLLGEAISNTRVKAGVSYNLYFTLYFSCATCNCVPCSKLKKKGDMVRGGNVVVIDSLSFVSQNQVLSNVLANDILHCLLMTYCIHQRNSVYPEHS